jgi:hypothetical protein
MMDISSTYRPSEAAPPATNATIPFISLNENMNILCTPLLPAGRVASGKDTGKLLPSGLAARASHQ